MPDDDAPFVPFASQQQHIARLCQTYGVSDGSSSVGDQPVLLSFDPSSRARARRDVIEDRELVLVAWVFVGKHCEVGQFRRHGALHRPLWDVAFTRAAENRDKASVRVEPAQHPHHDLQRRGGVRVVHDRSHRTARIYDLHPAGDLRRVAKRRDSDRRLHSALKRYPHRAERVRDVEHADKRHLEVPASIADPDREPRRRGQRGDIHTKKRRSCVGNRVGDFGTPLAHSLISGRPRRRG
jgi:hypothetical protein